ncbi:uncharacterized protein F4807DRAFT_447797 [Annulohypoxylon truncatum]|uniref:uncharacterized protein n=1 Tax=Annulohypoxylon truncatum TaxID=327061 RepID=UPI002007C503|nr:uncharacterized protein F4807DRAFT_447797 [Annulohypoxylon truncatum]KAI1204348.1 hypothetical protein F4807DRAFT_447797 [Annulohypoxylon truncatum]
MAYYHPDTPETGGPLAVSTLFGIIALLSCVARVYSVRQRSEKFHLQELYLFIALLLTFTSLGLQWACVVRGGTGRHMEDVDMLDAVLALKLIIPFEALYGVTLMFAKWSILLFYQRVFGVSRSSVRWFARATMVIVFLWMVSVVLETFLLCRPLAYNWDTSIKGSCGDRNTVYVVAGATNMVTDFMVLLIPVPTIWKLSLPISQRIALTATFGLGLFITAISIIRLKSLMDISFTDPTWTLPMGLMWTVLEPELEILVANFPFMRPYLSKILPKKWSLNPSSWRSRKYGNENFERLPADKGVPLQTIGGGWTGSNAMAGVAKPRNGGTPASDGAESERGLTKESDAGIQVHTMWSVSRE